MLCNFFHFFLKFNVNGKNNKIFYVNNKKKKRIFLVNNSSSIKINGNNNSVIFYSTHKRSIFFPEGFNLKINGNNNSVVIYEPNFENTILDIYGHGCSFILKKQSVQKVRSVFFGLGMGGKIFIDENCELGNGNLHVVVNGDYKEKHKLVIGKNVRIAKDAIIRTSDGHTLCDLQTGEPFSSPQDVILENNVWIMSRVTILKGSYISEGSAVAANALVNQKFYDKNILIGGLPAKIIRKNIKWEIDYYGLYMAKREKIK